MTKIRPLTIIALTLGVVFSASAQAADNYPNRPIRIIVPYTPGAINDILARRMAQYLGEELKQTVIVENKPGGGTAIGTEFVARANPDGYTLLQAAASHSILPSLMKKLPFDPLKSFEFITLAATSSYVMIATPKLPANNVAEFIALAKKEPGKYAYASTGNGSSAHLMGEMFKELTGADIMHVPYKGLAQGLNDVASGQVQVTFGTYPGSMAYLQPGRVKALATTGKHRMSSLPDVPTIQETVPGYEAQGWWGYLAPAGTPKPIVQKLNAAINNIIRSKAFSDTFTSEGVDMLGTSGEAFRTHVEQEMQIWGKLIQTAGIQAN
ncbi:tripartite tricarboxylate transporter substrate binding protein [Advenella mimigardefordensis]|uniref:Putative Bug-like extracytoplasmic solute binding receptor, TTT family n=1 Tax=Advenella mimigardefordensis (strain DSM 17166 / LMG 22922 / DPN7) TaxID=1247726 RepID=W0PCJ5_ADVMD|nr:tripartite tricarboxylate transporter substrate binding protein [Advenella mimigardefordensis]AHG64614.1 putative Bug-like extracytoplasmic solute binding receptor, TTT family [Advenella mimigardefordensis DPN7]